MRRLGGQNSNQLGVQVRFTIGRSAWRFGVPVVCLLAGILLATTHAVSGGDEIRGSDSPRLVDLVRDAQASVDRLTSERDDLTEKIGSVHGSVGSHMTVARLQAAALPLAMDAGLDAARGPGLVVTLTDAARDANGRFPRDASPDDLVVHEQDILGVLDALWSGGAEAIQVQDQRLIATSAVRCVGNTLLLNGRTYSPPYTIAAIGDATAMQEALDAAPLVKLYKQYAVRFGLGYSVEPLDVVEVAGYTEPIGVKFTQPQ